MTVISLEPTAALRLAKNWTKWRQILEFYGKDQGPSRILAFARLEARFVLDYAMKSLDRTGDFDFAYDTVKNLQKIFAGPAIGRDSAIGVAIDVLKLRSKQLSRFLTQEFHALVAAGKNFQAKVLKIAAEELLHAGDILTNKIWESPESATIFEVYANVRDAAQKILHTITSIEIFRSDSNQNSLMEELTSATFTQLDGYLNLLEQKFQEAETANDEDAMVFFDAMMSVVKGTRYRTLLTEEFADELSIEENMLDIREEVYFAEKLILQSESRKWFDKVVEKTVTTAELLEVIATRSDQLIGVIRDVAKIMEARNFPEVGRVLHDLADKIREGKTKMANYITNMDPVQRKAVLRNVMMALNVAEVVMSMVEKVPKLAKKMPYIGGALKAVKAVNCLVAYFAAETGR